jgi:acetyl esterase/lipase
LPSDIETKDFQVKAKDGHSIQLRWFRKKGSTSTSAVYYMHGGGMISCSLNIYNPIIANYVSNTGVPFLGVDYRLAPEVQYPTPHEDCFAGLVWLHGHAAELGVNPRRIAIMGDSAGGGLAACLALLARQRRGPAIAKQILLYPMLDDRNIQQDPKTAAFALWSAADNETAWTALLGPRRGCANLPDTAAPARLVDATGLPPAYVEVGELDLFRDEDVQYTRVLGSAGVSCELYLRPGCPHAFEVFAPNSQVSRRAMEDRYRAIRSVEALGGELPKM